MRIVEEKTSFEREKARSMYDVHILSTPMRVLRYTSAYIAVGFIFNRHGVTSAIDFNSRIVASLFDSET